MDLWLKITLSIAGVILLFFLLTGYQPPNGQITQNTTIMKKLCQLYRCSTGTITIPCTDERLKIWKKYHGCTNETEGIDSGGYVHAEACYCPYRGLKFG